MTPTMSRRATTTTKRTPTLLQSVMGPAYIAGVSGLLLCAKSTTALTVGRDGSHLAPYAHPAGLALALRNVRRNSGRLSRHRRLYRPELHQQSAEYSETRLGLRRQ